MTARRTFSEHMARPSRIVSVSERYSRFVGLMKLMLPLGAAALVIIVVVWPYLGGREDGIPLSFASIGLGLDEKVFMTNARYMGSDDNDQPYTLTAELIAEEEGVDNTIRLTKPQADIMMNNGSWLALTADSGVLNRDSEQLVLVGAVNFFSDSGYEFRTRRAEINLGSIRVHGEEPIEGQGPFGTLYADSFRLENQGKSLFFEGHVRVTYYPNSGAL
jgi:lipopolysaccharide export system protein LptC